MDSDLSSDSSNDRSVERATVSFGEFAGSTRASPSEQSHTLSPSVISRDNSPDESTPQSPAGAADYHRTSTSQNAVAPAESRAAAAQSAWERIDSRPHTDTHLYAVVPPPLPLQTARAARGAAAFIDSDVVTAQDERTATSTGPAARFSSFEATRTATHASAHTSAVDASGAPEVVSTRSLPSSRLGEDILLPIPFSTASPADSRQRMSAAVFPDLVSSIQSILRVAGCTPSSQRPQSPRAVCARVCGAHMPHGTAPDAFVSIVRQLERAGRPHDAAALCCSVIEFCASGVDAHRDSFGALLRTLGDYLVGCTLGAHAVPVPSGPAADAAASASTRLAVAVAVPLLREASRLAPVDDGVWLSLARAHAACGDVQSSFHALEMCVSINPRNVDGWQMLSDVYSSVGQAADAAIAQEQVRVLSGFRR